MARSWDRHLLLSFFQSPASAVHSLSGKMASLTASARCEDAALGPGEVYSCDGCASTLMGWRYSCADETCASRGNSDYCVFCAGSLTRARHCSTAHVLRKRAIPTATFVLDGRRIAAASLACRRLPAVAALAPACQAARAALASLRAFFNEFWRAVADGLSSTGGATALSGAGGSGAGRSRVLRRRVFNVRDLHKFLSGVHAPMFAVAVASWVVVLSLTSSARGVCASTAAGDFELTPGHGMRIVWSHLGLCQGALGKEATAAMLRHTLHACGVQRVKHPVETGAQGEARGGASGGASAAGSERAVVEMSDCGCEASTDMDWAVSVMTLLNGCGGCYGEKYEGLDTYSDVDDDVASDSGDSEAGEVPVATTDLAPAKPSAVCECAVDAPPLPAVPALGELLLGLVGRDGTDSSAPTLVNLLRAAIAQHCPGGTFEYHGVFLQEESGEWDESGGSAGAWVEGVFTSAGRASDHALVADMCTLSAT